MDFQTTILEIMSTDLTTVRPTTKVKDFKNLFKRRKFHHLPVEDENEKLVGIISVDDVNRNAHFFASPDSLMAQHIMTGDPFTIQEDTTIVDAVNFFLEHQVRALPVMNSAGDFVGIVTPYDLMKEMLRACQAEKELKDTEDLV